MRRALLALLALVVLAGAVIGLVLGRRTDPWTTDSEAARAELESALDARMKFYRQEARGHLQKALELDPGFAAAKVLLYDLEYDRGERARLLGELRAVDRARLSERERFLVDYTLAQADRDRERAERLITDYVEAHPEDPFGLAVCSESAWQEQSWPKAEEHYRRLLAADPNWVSAQNNLGYLAMAQGRFAEAEELFQTYKFIAPDQANPHDSLGELLTVVGRYEEARGELEEALAIKPDFCATYDHLMSLAKLQGLPEWTEGVLERAAAHCPEDFAAFLACDLELWRHYFAGEAAAVFAEPEPACAESWRNGRHFLIHRLAVLSGRLEEARAVEEARRAELADGDVAFPMDEQATRAFLLHMGGVRRAAEGDPAAAAEDLRRADELLYYWGGGQGILKLFNRLNLAAALELAGEAERSAAVLDQVRAVNPEFAGVYPWVRENLAASG